MRTARNVLTAVVIGLVGLIGLVAGLILTAVAIAAAVVAVAAAWPVALALVVVLVLLARRYGPRPPEDGQAAPVIAGRIGPTSTPVDGTAA